MKKIRKSLRKNRLSSKEILPAISESPVSAQSQCQRRNPSSVCTWIKSQWMLLRIRLALSALNKEQSIERVKMFYDFHKHMTTLNIGAVVLVATLGEKFTSNHHLTRDLANAFILFLVSILGCLMAMVVSPWHAGGKRMGKFAKIYFNFGALITFAAFGGAILCLENHLLLPFR